MKTIGELQEINHDRRRFLGTAALAIAAAELGLIGSAPASSDPQKPDKKKPAGNTSFGPLKQIDAGVLNVGYAEAGPAGGPPVVLLHGWPYDIHSFVEVAPRLASAGYRVIVPHLRGHGTTRFLSKDAVRNGQPSSSGGISSTSPPSAAERAMRSTATTSRSSSGSSPHRSGTSTTPRSRGALRPSPIRITSTS